MTPQCKRRPDMGKQQQQPPSDAPVGAAARAVTMDHKGRRDGSAIRCALDIGSSNHKLCVAEVDSASNTILRVLHTEQKQVMLKHALLQACDGRLSGQPR